MFKIKQSQQKTTNQTKPNRKPQNIAFGLNVFEQYFNKTACFNIVCGLYFENQTKLN